MPDLPDFAALRREADDAWLALNRDDRKPLREFLQHLVDAIEAVNDAGHEHVPDVAKWIAAVKAERRERDGKMDE